MRNRNVLIVAVMLLAACSKSPAPSAPATLSLDGAWGDNAVVQRDTPLTVSGDGVPGETVSVSIANVAAEATVGAAGRWTANIAPLSAGGPYTLTVHSQDSSLRAGNILAGDVLLCSGQSNMEYPVYRALNPDAVISESADENLRLLTVPKTTSLTPQTRLPEGATWTPASPDTVRDFSAICYFMGERLRRETHLPVGLINASWGGSQIEAWLPAPALESLGGFDSQLAQLKAYEANPDDAMALFGANWEDWWRTEHGDAPWETATDLSQWKDVPTFGDWHAFGDPTTADHLGRLWFARTFTLTPDQASGPATLSLGVFDDSDATWINGQFLGSTSSWTDGRVYKIGAGGLKTGTNAVLVNVLNTYGPGGMMGPADSLRIELSDGEVLPLEADWKYQLVEQDDDGGPRPPWESVSGFTTMHNAMMAPLVGTALRAAVWYQGESNTGRSGAYASLLAALSASWRDAFGEGLPIVIVQLPVYGAVVPGPAESGWADLRDAQRRVALDDPLTGLVVTLDVGDWSDIHPPNKQVVADRAIDVLLALQSQSASPVDGSSPIAAVRTGNTLTIELPPGDYTVSGSNRLTSTALCDGEAACIWADASLSANVIDVTLPPGFDAREIRYCWADAPVCNLFTAAGIPVTPFRLPIAP